MLSENVMHALFLLSGDYCNVIEGYFEDSEAQYFQYFWNTSIFNYVIDIIDKTFD